MHSVLIVGGGFGGVKLAQLLGRPHHEKIHVCIVDPKSYMQYRAATYRFVTGRSPMESCLLYRDLFEGLHVDLAKDSVVSIDLKKKFAKGASGSTYSFETLVLAVGGETATFGIPGVEKHAHDIGTFDGAIKLKKHIEDVCADAKWGGKGEKKPLLNIAVVGAGPTGVELAGELGWYVRKLARKNGADPSLVHIEIVEAMDRILPTMSPKVSKKVEKRLLSLGVDLLLKAAVEKEKPDALVLRNGDTIDARTVVWTAGLKANSLLSKISGLKLDKKGRVLVTDHLEAEGYKGVFALGDAASTEYSGMAQTALADAEYIAKVIERRVHKRGVGPYLQPAPSYAIPVGPKWAAVKYRGMNFYGFIGWAMRRAADLRAFSELLPISKALRAFFAGTKSYE